MNKEDMAKYAAICVHTAKDDVLNPHGFRASEILLAMVENISTNEAKRRMDVYHDVLVAIVDADDAAAAEAYRDKMAEPVVESDENSKLISGLLES